MTQQYGTHISWEPRGCYTIIILLSNINMSVYAANGGQHQHMLLIFYNIFTQAPEISAQVGVQERMKSAHLLVDNPIGARPRPSRAVTSRAPRVTVTAKIVQSNQPHTPQRRA